MSSSSTGTTPEICFTLSSHLDLPPGVRGEEVLETMGFVWSILAATLETPMPLDGCSRLDIVLGPEGDEPRYFRDGDRSVVYQPSFSPDAWKKKKDVEGQETYALDSLAEILDRVLMAFRGERVPLREGVKKVQRSGFEATVVEDALSCEVPEDAPGEVLRVLRTLRRNGETWGLEVQGRRGKVLREEQIGKGLSSEEAEKKFCDFRWDGGEYVLLNSRGRASFRVDLSPAA